MRLDSLRISLTNFSLPLRFHFAILSSFCPVMFHPITLYETKRVDKTIIFTPCFLLIRFLPLTTFLRLLILFILSHISGAYTQTLITHPNTHFSLSPSHPLFPPCLFSSLLFSSLLFSSSSRSRRSSLNSSNLLPKRQDIRHGANRGDRERIDLRVALGIMVLDVQEVGGALECGGVVVLVPVEIAQPRVD